MKIRNLQKYIENITNRNLNDLELGTDKDFWLKELNGGSTNISKYIGDITAFAKDTTVQIFYEFLQNAEDSKSKYFFVFFDEDNLLVINTGKPFYTDNNEEHKGQLSRFLALKKTDKEKDNIGKHGQGSKLLYDFFLNKNLEEQISDDTKKTNQLNKVIIDELKGAIVFSWKGNTNVDSLLNGDSNEVSDDFDDLENVLLTKIIYTYYPAMLGETKKIGATQKKEVLFTKEEYKRFTTFFSHISKQYSISTSILLEGTALYIPLGKGQGKALKAEIQKGKITKDIEVSLGLLKNVQQVQINEIKIKKDDFRKNYNIKKLDAYVDKTAFFSLIYPNNPAIFDEKTSNFFQYFPIQNEIHKLKYIIDTNSYTITQDRQNIDIDNSHNEENIKFISEKIIEYLQKLVKENNKSEFNKLFLCVLFSEEPNSDFYKEYFYTNFDEFIIQNLPVSKGFSQDYESVLIPTTNLDIHPKDIGILDKDWLDKDLMPYKEKITERFGVINCNILELFALAENNKIADYVEKLSQKDYDLLLSEIIENTKNIETIKNIPFVKFTDNKIYSINQILEPASNLLIITNKTKNIQEILHKRSKAIISENIITSDNSIFENIIKKFNDDEFLFGKINKILDFNKLIRDDKWIIFKNFIENFDIEKIEDALRNDLLLFQNNKKELKPLSLLIKDVDKYSKIGLLNEFKILPEEQNYFEILDDYLMQDEEVWQYFYNDWKNIKTRLQTDENIIKKLYKEVQEIYDLAEKEDKKEFLPNKLDIIFTKNNDFVRSNTIFYNEKITKNSQNYTHLLTILEKETTYNLVEFQYFEDLENPIFKLENQNLSEFYENLESDSIEITSKQLEILLLLKGSGESIFDKFLLRENANQTFYLQKRKTNQYQYYIKDELLNAFLNQKNDYFLLPDSLKNLLGQDQRLKIENDNFVQELIERYGSEKSFIDLVKRQGQTTKQIYFNKISTFELNSEEGKYEKDSYEAKFLDLAIQNQWLESLKAKTKINGKNFTEFNVEDNISLRIKTKEEDKVNYLSFSLSEILPKYKGVSDILKKVKDKFEIITKDFFTQNKISFSQINNELKSIKVSAIYQLTYLVAYFCSENSEKDMQKGVISNYLSHQNFNPNQVLEAFFEKKLFFYTEHYQINDFIPKNCIYVNSENKRYIHSNENTPAWVEKWCENEKNKVDFLYEIGVKNDSFSAIRFRKNVIENNSLEIFVIDNLINEPIFCENTFQFLANNIPIIKKRDNNYRVLSDFIGKYAEKKGIIPPYYLVLEKYEEKEGLVLKYKNHITTPLNLYFEKYNESYLKHLHTAKQKLNKNLIDANHSKFKEILEKNNIKEAKITSDFLEQKTKDIKEWEVSYYQEWKQDENVKYRFFLSKSPIWFEYKINLELIEEKNDGRIGMSTDNKIYIHKASFENKSILDILEEYKEEYFKEKNQKDQLIKLFQLANPSDQEREILEKIKKQGISLADLQNYTSPKNANKQDQEILTLIEKQGISNKKQLEEYFAQNAIIDKNIIELSKNVTEKQKTEIESIVDFLSRQKEDVLHKILELLTSIGMDSNMLASFLENKDLLKSLLENERKVHIKGITGYIGEMLTYHWLKRYEKQGEISKLKYVADERPECDFSFETKNEIFEIDTKTTIGSVYEENSIPFYLKLSQYRYLNQKQPENYLILRIGLKDISEDLVKIKKKYDNSNWQDYKENINQEIEMFLNNSSNFDNFNDNKILFRLATKDLESFDLDKD